MQRITYRHHNYRLLSVAALSVLLLFGCSETEDTQSPTVAPEGQERQPSEQHLSEQGQPIADEPDSEVHIDQSRPARALPRRTANTESSPDLSPPDQAFRELYQNIANSTPTMPLDTELDRLQTDPHTADSVLSAFFTALQDRTFAKELVVPDEQFALEIALEPLMQSEISISDYRLGEFRSDNDDTRVPLRLFTADSSGIGEIIITSHEEDWQIRDISFPWEQLEAARTPLRFEPATHQWTVGTRP